MKKGFTLIEMLTVVLLIAVLSAVAMPQYRRSIERSRMSEAIEMLPAIYDAMDRYYVENPPSQALNKKAGVGGGTVTFTVVSTKVPKFSELDITLKGKPVPGKDSQWETANFRYVMSSNTMSIKNSPGDVSATYLRGKYQNTVLYYNGKEISCCDENADAQGACDLLALSTSCGTSLPSTGGKDIIHSELTDLGEHLETTHILQQM